MRRISGDLDEFQREWFGWNLIVVPENTPSFSFVLGLGELQKVVGEGTSIKRRVASFEITGNHTLAINEWLVRLGF